MRKSYYIFKTDLATNKTVHICNGSHDNEHECLLHWQAYMYGFMDGAFELLGRKGFEILPSTRHELRAFEILVPGKKHVEYFMLFDKEGQDLIYEICNEENR